MTRRHGTLRVLITGGASGLGAALAARYTAGGAHVMVADLVEAPANQNPAVYQRLDITSVSDWTDIASRVGREFGGIDILINNAGIAAGGRIEQADEQHWRRTLDVNVLGAVNGCRAFVPMFKQQGHGHIVNIASLAGLVHPAAMSSYNASKAAVVALSETLRYELRPWGIDVSVVCPSFFRSNLAASVDDGDPLAGELATKLIDRAPRTADDVAAHVIESVERKQFLVLPDRPARLAYWTKRLAGPIYRRQMNDLGAKIRCAEGHPRVSDEVKPK
ncbi:SDR family NAD(P)-dependent oxidoreductase [Mycolicibacterium sp. HK-90]|uniref:SDR family NAD(P)-dependent oxidoreductase n=1 Tax=Mycolicibacterium sp. HK-90 TaxID=3056937 RepID=UPI0026595CA2|nr:SDR family NAD(P)-dependent oxidoreductase [Mycolicibacterium sp. HK-90]WKG04026.1 SDR family NAD(P)-dependent oxidoreductase [Mycolicibacterium sp. HK-90]